MACPLSNFLRWVPSAARAKIEEICAADLRPEKYEIVNRLAIDLKMKTVWTSLARIGGEGKEGEVIRCAFMRACQTLDFKPPFPRRKKDREAHLRREARALNERGFSLEFARSSTFELVQAMTTKDNEVIAKLLFKSLPPDASPNFEALVAWARYTADVYAWLSEQWKELNQPWALPLGRCSSTF
jgi:hypothetical protein